MRDKSALFFGLLILLPFSVALAQSGGVGDAMTLVGTWDVEVTPSGGDPFKALNIYHLGGSWISSPSTTFGDADDLQITSYGSWKKVRGDQYIASFYFLLDDPDFGHIYLKGRSEIVLLDKNNFEGRRDQFLLLGRDPFNPIATIPLSDDALVGRRLGAEGPAF